MGFVQKAGSVQKLDSVFKKPKTDLTEKLTKRKQYSTDQTKIRRRHEQQKA
ncbi:hypothetical protein SVXNc_0647 [Candidatus Nanohalococcus occultus]|uniref:30S ribosomal protein S21 n=1 Tax=Candidatus Nanohalococcus occultus TaxID=2978047 RepID=A0ABY8CK05_9ARCH|nr:hypothetical protein SVXNc_0647 [Candidatus Nanohaloarchaeota archaeon SVXNc]